MAIEKFLSLLAGHLRKVAEDIDAGNSNLSEEEALDLFETIRAATDREALMSKYEACRYLNMSKSAFDNYVRRGEIPRGIHRAGFKELGFRRRDLDDFIKRRREKNKGC